jgi:hypothetical protein
VLREQTVFFFVTKIYNKKHAPSVPRYMHKECNICFHCLCSIDVKFHLNLSFMYVGLNFKAALEAIFPECGGKIGRGV